MIATKPAVQFNCKSSQIYVCLSAEYRRWFKRVANRRHRRALNRAVRRMEIDVELFYNEGFNAPSLSSWDID